MATDGPSAVTSPLAGTAWLPGEPRPGKGQGRCHRGRGMWFRQDLSQPLRLEQRSWDGDIEPHLCQTATALASCSGAAD